MLTQDQKILLADAREKAKVLVKLAEQDAAELPGVPECAAVIDAARQTLDNLVRSLHEE